MANIKKNLTKEFQDYFSFFASAILILSMLVGCSSSPQELENVDYTPLIGAGWQASTPQEQRLDPLLVAEMYHNAAELETLYSLLVVKNGYLIAEDYFNEGSIGGKTLLQSASKSYVSALVGIALEEGYLSSVDQKMVDFFPEHADQITDPRKKQITIREMLQMRAGYPDEETDQAYLDALYWGEYPHLIVDFPLVSDPGTSFNYSNLTFSWLAILLARACGTDLKSYAQEYLFQPMDTEVGDWLQDRDGNYIGSGGIHLTARDAAKFGLLYLNDGEYKGEQIIPSDWVHASLQSYSENTRDYGRSLSFRDLGYGYGWWTARAGEHSFSFAWGHGGQLIVLLDELDMVIVTTADPFFGQHDGNSWTHEKATINLVGEFIKSLPGE
jgi:CubicO group peptidase (beta-lactamase class C family)